jgi:rare lipoprotein A
MRIVPLFYSVLWICSLLTNPILAQEITQIGYKQIGKASFFPDDRNGLITKSGEKYDPTALEAAHATIAFNSLVKITNLDNKKEVIVRINDRPQTHERIIDMTQAAANALGMTDKKTVIEVKIELIQLGVGRNNAKEILAEAYRRIATQPSEEVEEITKEEEIYTRYEGESPNGNPIIDEEVLLAEEKQKEAQAKRLAETKKKEEKKKAEESKKAENTKNKGVISTTANLKAKAKDKVSFDPTHTYTPDGDKVKPTGFGVQVASYDEINKALKEVIVLEKLKLGQVYVQAGWANGKKTYRLLIGSFKTKELAQKTADKLNQKNYKSFPKKHFD